MIIRRYIFLEILRPMALVCLVLVVIFASFSSAAYLADAASGLFSAQTVASLTALKTLITLEALLPTALYLAIIVGLGRMYSDTEITALQASGVSEFQILKHIAWLILFITMLVASLTLYIRPWAYQMVYKLEALAIAELDINKLEGGRFYRLGRTDNILFAAHVDKQSNRLRGVFFRSISSDEGTQIIRAKEAYLPDAQAVNPVIIFREGWGYNLNKDGSSDLTLQFNSLTLVLTTSSKSNIRYRSKAATLTQLGKSTRPKDIAEFQWRFSMPFTTLVLGFLAIPLSRSRPRQGRFAKLFTAILIYALYYNLLSVASTWMKQGKVGIFPGIWWAHLIPLAILFLLLLQPYMHFRLKNLSRISGA